MKQVWYPWNGGENPASHAYVDYILRSGEIYTCMPAQQLDWSNGGKSDDIIAYALNVDGRFEGRHPDPSSKPTNPKDAIGSNKLPLHLWPETATAMGCIGMLNGALKYGRSNFRAIGVRASIYVDAAKRHLNAWFEGEECDLDDGVPHLAAALCCIAIIVDADAAGKLTDDRMVAGGYRGLVSRLTDHVTRLKELHEEKNPKHYTIEDTPC